MPDPVATVQEKVSHLPDGGEQYVPASGSAPFSTHQG